jgi:hypothetical protein
MNAQLLESGAQDCYGCLELMGCIGGKAGGLLQLFARFFERNFGALPLGTIIG